MTISQINNKTYQKIYDNKSETTKRNKQRKKKKKNEQKKYIQNNCIIASTVTQIHIFDLTN